MAPTILSMADAVQRQRLEDKFGANYERHIQRTNKIDWSYHNLIPWERGRNFITDPWHPSQATISPELAVAVATALLTEVNLPWFTAGLTELFRGEFEVLQDFVRTWTSEEDQHSNILETYLLVTRNHNPDQLHALRKAVVRKAWIPGEASAVEGMAYTIIQELSTQAFYISVAKKADIEDPVLANILRTIAKDETLHYAFYREALKAVLEVFPRMSRVLWEVLMNFAMPGFLMPDFEERVLIMRVGANYGIAEYYKNVVEVIVSQFRLDSLDPDLAEEWALRQRVDRYLTRLATLAARVTQMGHREEELARIRQAAEDMLGYNGVKPFKMSLYTGPQLTVRDRSDKQSGTELIIPSPLRHKEKLKKQ